VVPTAWFGPDDEFDRPGGEYVIKPAVSAGSKDTGRYGPGDAELAHAHVARLQAAGLLVMVQPYLPAVDTYGETALAVLRPTRPPADGVQPRHPQGPMLAGP